MLFVVGVTGSDLDEYKQWARERLTPFLGPLRLIEQPGGPQGLHDFAADLADGSIAAIEVTGEVDGQRRSLAAQTRRKLASYRFSALALQGSDEWGLGAPPGDFHLLVPRRDGNDVVISHFHRRNDTPQQRWHHASDLPTLPTTLGDPLKVSHVAGQQTLTPLAACFPSD
jgi:hypothetical protein